MVISLKCVHARFVLKSIENKAFISAVFIGRRILVFLPCIRVRVCVCVFLFYLFIYFFGRFRPAVIYKSLLIVDSRTIT